MKLTTEGMPLIHLTRPHHINTISNYDCAYLLVNEMESEINNLDSTPSIDSIFIAPTILNDFAFETTRAIPIKKSHRNQDCGIIIGRSASCDIVLNSAEVSRRHLRILADGEIAFVENLSKTNGLTIGNEKKGIVKLESQTIMCLGGLVGAVFISSNDLELLCSMLPEHWNKANTETRTSIELPIIAPLAQW